MFFFNHALPLQAKSSWHKMLAEMNLGAKKGTATDSISMQGNILQQISIVNDSKPLMLEWVIYYQRACEDYLLEDILEIMNRMHENLLIIRQKDEEVSPLMHPSLIDYPDPGVHISTLSTVNRARNPHSSVLRQTNTQNL